MRGLRLLLILLVSLVLCEREELSESIIQKDLYKTLGVGRDATAKEIKKAYRSLAQQHHPDKAKAGHKERNEVIFREIAEAYEVLSDGERRQEYDMARDTLQAREQMKFRYHQQQEEYQRQQYHRFQQMEEDAARYMEQRADEQRRYYAEYLDQLERQEQYLHERHHDYIQSLLDLFDQNEYASRGRQGRRHHGAMHDDLPSGHGKQFQHPQPVVSGSMLQAGQPIFPYSPIMTSSDGSHFAFLDWHCALGVYEGMVDDLLRLLLVQDPPDLTNLPLKLKFRTTGEPSLRGHCFAGLDDEGILRVYQGHPAYGDFSPIWSSDTAVDETTDASLFARRFQRFYLELASTGELAVLRLTPGESEVECVWSTTSCNAYLAMLKEVQLTLVHRFRTVIDGLKAFLTHIERVVGDAVDDVRSRGLSDAFTRALQRIGDGIARATKRFWQDKENTNENNRQRRRGNRQR